MKPLKSLFQVATEKYTSLSKDIAKDKKTFLFEMDATSLNQLYAGKDDKQAKPITFSDNTDSNTDSNTASDPGGSEKPTTPSQPAAIPGPKNPEASSVPSTSAGTLDVTGPDVIKTKLADGRTLCEDPTGKVPPVILTPEQVQSLETVKNIIHPKFESVNRRKKSLEPTNEDILDALKTLSTGEVMATSIPEDGEMVQPAGDTLHEEGEDTHSEDGELATDEAMSEPATSTSSDIEAPPDGIKSSTASSSSTGSKGSASSFMPEKSMETNKGDDNRSGVDSSYTVENDKANPQEYNGAGAAKVKANKFSGGGAGAGKDFGHTGESEPEIGENSSCVSGEYGSETEGDCAYSMEGETNPSGKESAFWVPDDDILGLKDIIATNAKNNGTPDAQETIGKDATGNLVKKPTTPVRAIPNMRQYVKTNPMTSIPNMGPTGNNQPVDISDLDGVMGMDAQSDRALNISLNFNF